MSEKIKQTTNITWRPDYKAEPLLKTDWNEKNGWDFLGCIVDIQLRRADGDYFFVKYVGSIEGIDLDTSNDGDEEVRTIYHFGVEKMTGERWMFRPENIFVIRNHHSSKVEKETTYDSYLFPLDKPLTKDLIQKLDIDDESYEVDGSKSCCISFL
jgi:hypothetical protein